MKFKVGDKVKILDGENIPNYVQGWNMPEYVGDVVTIKERILYPDNYIGYRVEENLYIFDERGLAPAMNIEVQPLELVCNQEKAKEIAERLTKELNGMLGVSFKKNKEEKKMSTKFTFNVEQAEKLAKQIKEKLSGSEIGFTREDKEDRPMTYYVTDGKRIDKTCNKHIETKTTHVAILGGRYTGKATCDAENYDQRQGLLEAIANAVCGGNFDKHYNDDIKARKRLEKALCRCSICGVTYDTASEARACEQAHKDHKQAKLEKYLISKEAKRRIAEAERENKIEELMKDLLKKKVEK